MAKMNDIAVYGTMIVVSDADRQVQECLPSAPLGILADYQPSLKEVLGHEGGFTDESTDPGGPTNWGITIHDARMYWKVDATREDVKRMPLAVAKDIYKSKYWDAVRGDELPPGIDYCVFDYAVNSGLGRARPLLQKLIGVTVDGKFGPETMKVLAIHCATPMGRALLINNYQDHRLAFLQSLHHWPTYRNGWTTRVREVRASALKMSNAAPTVVVNTPVTNKPPPLTPRADRPGQPPPVDKATPGLLGAIAAILKALFGKK